MKRHVQALLFIGLFAFSFSLRAQGWISQGARSRALANNGVALVDVFSYHHNPGALAFLKKGKVGLSYEARYALKELQTQSFAAAVPLKVGVISAGGQFYGYNAYRTTRAGLGYSMKLSKHIAAGVQVNYLSLRLPQHYGVKRTVSAGFGALAKVNDRINIGLSVVNIGRMKLAEYTEERFGTLLRLGASYQVLEQLLIVAEIEEEISYQPRFRVGLEYHPIDMLYIRAGVQGAPMDFAFGFGLDYNRFKLDFSCQYNQRLGWSPGVSFIVDFYDPAKKKTSSRW